MLALGSCDAHTPVARIQRWWRYAARRAKESVPPRACHRERSAPPSAAGVGCGWCSGAVIEQQAPARHAECTRDASRVHDCSCSAKQRPPAQRKEPVPTRARLRQLERLSASAGSHPVGSQCLGSQAHRRREQLRATPRRAKATLSSVAAAARFRHAVGCGGGRGLRQPRSRPAGGLGGRSHAATISGEARRRARSFTAYTICLATSPLPPTPS